MKIKRKVVCVFGKFDEESDFVLEPVIEELYKKGYYKKEKMEVIDIEGEEEVA